MKVLKGSKLATIQDGGRIGFRKFGVPISGCMDELSAGLVNAILGNRESEALIEVAMSGFELESERNSLISISGTMGEWTVNEQEIEPYRMIPIQSGDRVRVQRITFGNYLYLAVKGGFQTERVMGSRSMYPKITSCHSCETGMSLSCFESNFGTHQNSSVKVSEGFQARSEAILVSKGPEYDLLDSNSKLMIEKTGCVVSPRISRMGFVLEHDSFTLKEEVTMQSSAVLPGTIQLLPSGKCIVLMKDAQTTGGYPRILQVHKSHLSKFAQFRPGSTFKFQMNNFPQVMNGL